MIRVASLVFRLAAIAFASVGVGRGATTPWNVILGRPTDHSIALSLLAADSYDVVVDYGTQTGVYRASSATMTFTDGLPVIVPLDGLKANTTYFYRIRYRLPGAATYTAADESTFVTQRVPGRSFTFAVEADPHHRDNEPAVWQSTLANILADKPDFLIDLGDTFMDEKQAPTTYAPVDQTHREVRNGFFSVTGASVPLFLVNGNHDPELGWALSRTAPLDNMAMWGVRARETYFPCPAGDSFYSGATANDVFTGAPRDGYYAWTWGDALFVVLDPYWYSSQATPKSKNPWQWTLGRAQYDWFKQTLEQSQAAYKFVFLHNLVGGSHDGIARGGVEFSSYYEWGGRNADGTDGFAANRPGWPMPIQDVLLANHVAAVFHGHDHLFAKQDLDTDGDGKPELIYQEVPQPSRTNQSTTSGVGYGYVNGVLYPSSGHLRVRVSPEQATVEYVRSVVSTDRATVANGAVQFQYTVPPFAAMARSSAGNTRLSNLSVRSRAGSGDATLILGLVVGSGSPPQLLFRAAGPSLRGFGISGGLPDPTLALYAGPSAVASNDDWGSSPDPARIASAAAATGAFSFASGSKDSALLTSLAAGGYTIQVQPKSAEVGVVLVEAYMTSMDAVAPLRNVSSRAFVGTGDAVLISGFVIDGAGLQRVLIRVVGPTLADFGVSGVLTDPALALYQGATVLATNNGWSASANASAISVATAAVGAFALPTGSKDAAILTSLPAGTYSAVVSGVGATTGIVLLEVYVVN